MKYYIAVVELMGHSSAAHPVLFCVRFCLPRELIQSFCQINIFDVDVEVGSWRGGVASSVVTGTSTLWRVAVEGRRAERSDDDG